jgi:hypothetical protein
MIINVYLNVLKYNMCVYIYIGSHEAMINIKCNNCKKKLELHVVGKTLTPLSEVVVAAALQDKTNSLNKCIFHELF